MKATGIVRRIDDLGRVVIPKEIRRTMRIREGDPSLTTLIPVLSSFMRKFVCSPGERSHPAREALSIASRCFMFMYFLLPH